MKFHMDVSLVTKADFSLAIASEVSGSRKNLFRVQGDKCLAKYQPNK